MKKWQEKWQKWQEKLHEEYEPTKIHRDLRVLFIILLIVFDIVFFYWMVWPLVEPYVGPYSQISYNLFETRRERDALREKLKKNQEELELERRVNSEYSARLDELIKLGREDSKEDEKPNEDKR